VNSDLAVKVRVELRTDFGGVSVAHQSHTDSPDDFVYRYVAVVVTVAWATRGLSYSKALAKYIAFILGALNALTPDNNKRVVAEWRSSGDRKQMRIANSGDRYPKVSYRQARPIYEPTNYIVTRAPQY